MMLCSCMNQESKNVNSLLSSHTKTVNDQILILKEELSEIKDFAESLYIHQNEILPQIDKSKYSMYQDNIFYKKTKDQQSAVFVTGFKPIDEEVKKAVYFTEPLEKPFKSFIERHKQVSQIYYNDKNSYNRIYPWFDVLTQYSANIDITQFSFYSLANETNNPSRKVIIVEEPYIDPAGRGWIISIISPVYYNKKLEGVLGIDINTNELFDSLNKMEGYSYLIVNKSGLVISSSKDIEVLFNLPDKSNVKYINLIVKEELLDDSFNLQKSKSREIRELFSNINHNQQNFRFELNERTYQVCSSAIENMSWKIVLMKREK